MRYRWFYSRALFNGSCVAGSRRADGGREFLGTSAANRRN
jgi:hypothetical protein